MILNAKKAAFFGAHTDDEFIAAGTLHRLTRAGCEVHVVSFSQAATEGDRLGENLSLTVHGEWERSMDLIGVLALRRHHLGWRPSASLHTRGQEIADYAFAFCEKHKPDLAFILSPEDENPAHAEVGRQCERVMRGRVPTVLRCNFPWNLNRGHPNMFVRLDEEDLTVKRSVINTYQSQKFRYDYESILMHFAYAEGLSVKVPAAEAFELLRAVV